MIIRLGLAKLVLLFVVAAICSCSSNQSKVSTSQQSPMPTPGPVVTGSGETVYKPAVMKQPKSKVSSVTTTLSSSEKKTVIFDAQRTEFDYNTPSKSKLIMSNTKPSEAYLAYPGASKFHVERVSKSLTNAEFTIYPTKDPDIGLGKGKFEWAIFDIDWNKPGETQNVSIQNMNFNPGATVFLGDSNYAYPLIPGKVVRGKGVKFVQPSAANPSGIQLMPGTTIEAAK